MFVGRAESGAAATTSSRPQTNSLIVSTYTHKKCRKGAQFCTSLRAAPPRRMVSLLQRTVYLTNEIMRYALCECLGAFLIRAARTCPRSLEGLHHVLQEEAFVEISGEDLASGDAFAELVGMAVEVQPSLADRATRDLAASQRASASVAGMHPCHVLKLT